MTKRAQVTDYILKHIKISKYTYDIVKGFLESMSNDDFHAFMLKIKNKKANLSFIVPHDEVITEEQMFELADKLKIKVFQKLTFHEDDITYTSNIPSMVIPIPGKRAAQTQDKKQAIPTGNKINTATGQVTGDSRAAKLTMPEILVHTGFGIKKPIEELMNGRGGDLGLGNAMDNMLFNYGSVNLDNLNDYKTKVVSTKTLKAYFLASHIRSTL